MRLTIEQLESRDVPATYIWTGADMGGENKWSTPGNWKIGNDPAPEKPGLNDDVVFDGSAGGNSWSNVDEDFGVRCLKIDKTLAPAAGSTLTLAHDLTLTGDSPGQSHLNPQEVEQ
jgi:hypothetical protein